MLVEIQDKLAHQLSKIANRRRITLEHLIEQHLAALVPAPPPSRRKRAPLIELDWMDGYSGQSTRELLAFENHERVDLLAIAFEEGIRDAIQKTGSWSGVERTVLAVMTLFREVGNGGFDQFFRNSSRRHALAIDDDLVRIGCADVARIARRAIRALKLKSRTLPEIERAMATLDPKRDRILNECDIAFYEHSEIPKRVIGYIKAHPNGISF